SLEVDSFWERGLIGVALDPDFPRNGHVYVCYVAPKSYPHHRVSRFTARGDVAVPGSEVVLLRGDDQRKLGGAIPAGHQGGGLHFGKGGKLYVAIGEQTAGAPSQRLDTFQGKLLRINAYDRTVGRSITGGAFYDPPAPQFPKRYRGKYFFCDYIDNWVRVLDPADPRTPEVFATGLRGPVDLAVAPDGSLYWLNRNVWVK